MNRTPPVAPSALPPRGAPLADRQSRLRGGRLVAWAAAFALGSAVAQTPAPKKEPGAPMTIEAPHYGDVVFHFYQDKTFTALTGLMVSQHFERISPHDEEAEVLRGGMLLSYGLHDEAAAVFAALIERNAAVGVRNRAWYFLAKVRHQRGLNTQAQASLDRIEGKLVGTLEEDRQLLQAQLMMEREDYAGAAALLETLKASPNAGLYAQFNLGVSLVRIGDTEKGLALLDAVGQTPAPNEELRSLRDRANVALGFAQLANKKPRDARASLQRVRLNAAVSNKALLGYGWAATELNDPKLALVPWTELSGRAGIGDGDAAVLEARIAVPYAYAELGAFTAALKGYQDAADGFEKEQQSLLESIAAIRAGKLVQGLIAQNPSEGLAAFTGIRSLPEMPHASHLVPLLASDEFQEAFKNLRDLQFLDGNLGQWQDSLGVFTDMLDNRKLAFEQKLPKAKAGDAVALLAAMKARRDALVAELEKVQAEGDAEAFATAKERDLLDRIQRGRATLEEAAKAPSADELAEAAERLRRAAGALTWTLSQDMPARAWDAKKGLRDTTIALAQAADRNAALAAAQEDEPLRHARFAERIAELEKRLLGLRPDVAVVAREVQLQLQDVAIAELERQQERLSIYAAQARLAIAQIHDRAQFARRSDTNATEAPK